MTRENAFELLKQYNQEPFHIKHALTVEAVMRWFANDMGYGEEADFWATVGLLHDLDFEQFPEEHCVKGQELMRAAGVDERTIRACASHGWGIACDVEPEHPMEKALFAVDELTGLVGAVAVMRPSKSTLDLPVKSVMKKFKTPAFAAGCSREVIQKGADLMGMTLEELIEKTILAMRAFEQSEAN